LPVSDEAAAIRERGGLLIKLTKESSFSVNGVGHSSEPQDLPFDVHIRNIFDCEALYALLDIALQEKGAKERE
jgi:hypothetical protein